MRSPSVCATPTSTSARSRLLYPIVRNGLRRRVLFFRRIRRPVVRVTRIWEKARRPACLTCLLHVGRRGARHAFHRQQWKRVAAAGRWGSGSSVRSAQGGNRAGRGWGEATAAACKCLAATWDFSARGGGGRGSGGWRDRTCRGGPDHRQAGGVDRRGDRVGQRHQGCDFGDPGVDRHAGQRTEERTAEARRGIGATEDRAGGLDKVEQALGATAKGLGRSSRTSPRITRRGPPRRRPSARR